MNDEVALRINTADQWHRTLRAAITAAGWVGVAYCASLAIGQFAGQNTNLFVGATLSVIGKLSVAVPSVVAASCCAWAVGERKIRQRNTAYLTDRIRKLESDADPNRTTSGLMRTGATNPRDIRK